MAWLSLVAALVLATLAVFGLGLWQLRALGRRVDATGHELRREIEAARQAMTEAEARVRALERVLREQMTVDVVMGNLLVEKGLVDEDEIEATHQRLVIEPALLDGEHESLLDELPEPEQLRARLIRNLPSTLQ
jgi:hypothetical protein